MEIKSIIGKKEFEANGRKYTIMDKISINRWIIYEKLQPRVTFGLGFEEMYANCIKAYQYLNQQKFADAAVVMHNMANGIKSATDEKRAHPVLLMASLFVVRDNEDLKVYDEKLALEKIEDWQAEGLNMADFFSLSLSSIRGFRETLLRSTQEELKKIEEMTSNP